MKLEKDNIMSGVYERETDEYQEFHWCEPLTKIRLPPPQKKYLLIELFSDFDDFSQKTNCFIDKKLVVTLTLILGWGTYMIPLNKIPQSQTMLLTLETNKCVIAPNDSRTLAIRIGEFEYSDLLNNPKLHITENARLNKQEFIDGKSVLKSYPPRLSIDIHGICNYRPQCVYCEYDFVKTLEGANTTIPFTVETLHEMGPFFTYADHLTNCSIGEPFLSKDMESLLNEFEHNKKKLTLASNGSLLNEKHRKMLIGKHINIHISFDAATPETYAKFRNKMFLKVVDNARKLIKERQENPWPRVHLVFMPMHANIHELEDFIKLAAGLGVDVVVLRPLNEIASLNPPDGRGGYIFEYDKERLSFDELIAVSKKASIYAKQYGVKLLNQLNFEHVLDSLLATEDALLKKNDILKIADNYSKPEKNLIIEEPQKKPVPICREPWETLVVLRAGVKPCCYGHTNIGDLDQFKKVWNGEEIRDIRDHLAKGEFSEYCLKSTSCPLVRKHFAEGKK